MHDILSHKLSTLLFGIVLGFAFAPTFFTPALITLSVLLHLTYHAKDAKQAFTYGLLFGFGSFLSSMYWIAMGVGVYIDEFWWAIPFALFGLPLILALFIAGVTTLSWFMKNSQYFHLAFCVNWVFFEWLRSWIFTGLPWNLLGYALTFNNTLIQSASIFGIYGLSFFVIYIASSFYHVFTLSQKRVEKTIITTSVTLIILITTYGAWRLKSNPTSYTSVAVRLVQPSIPQAAKWNEHEFWQNLDAHINLSTPLNGSSNSSPQLIIWSEAALVVPFRYPPIKDKIIKMLKGSQIILITGGITDNFKEGDDYEIYTSLQAIDAAGNILFEYHKSHLVPFGEYMPCKDILPMKKLTPGFVDYTQGNPKLVSLATLGLVIKPIICYEAIFPDLVRTSNKTSDVIVNVTNDAWYGNSSGPYQHLHITRLRAIENGLPILRVGNNGISAIIDPTGRITEQLGLNKVGTINGYLPNKLSMPTLYSHLGNLNLLLAIGLVLLIQTTITRARNLSYQLKSQT